MKFLILILMQSGLVWWQLQWILQFELTMLRVFSVLEYCKVMKDKYRKLFLIHKELKSFQQDLTKLPESGMLRLEKHYKFYKVMKIRYFHASLTTKGISSSQDQRIILAKFGEMSRVKKCRKIDFSNNLIKIVLQYNYVMIYLYICIHIYSII